MITKGRHTYGDINRGGEGNKIIIGAFCSIAAGVVFDSGMNHNWRIATTFPFNCLWPAAGHIKTHPVIKGDIIIGNDVTIGMNSMIMSGVTIGDGAVIGAMSFISKDVPPYAIVVGANRFLRFRFHPDQINQLMNLRWWDWPDEKIAENVELLMSTNIEELCKK